MSLSRAFRYAGVPSTVMSLWKVPDDATSKIMSHFYQFLKEGDTKDSALRRAKLAYLDQTITPEQKHPFYWAGFVAAGDMEKISVSSFNFWKWGMRLTFVIGFIFLFRFLEKNNLKQFYDVGNPLWLPCDISSLPIFPEFRTTTRDCPYILS